MKKVKIFLFLTIIMLLFTTSCGDIKFTTSTNKKDDFDLVEFENSVIEVSKKVENAVIGVTLKGTYSTVINFKPVESEDVESIGSGVIYKRIDNYKNDEFVNYTYYAITNRHVILGNKTDRTYKVYAYLGYEDTEIEATILGYDKCVDMAVIKFDSTTKIEPVEFANSDKIEKGQFVIAVGNPDGYEYYGSVTFGVISGTLRYISDDTDDDGVKDFNATYIQHDASINPGNSGGGLFTTDGKLVGINTLKLVDDTIDNMGFAIPSNVIKSIATNYLENGLEVVRPRLGVVGIEVKVLTNAVIAANGLLELPDIFEGKKYGIYVTEVTQNGTMDATNLQKDDIILSFDGVKLYNMNELSARLNSLADYRVGSVVKIEYYSRSTNKIVVEEVTLK